MKSLIEIKCELTKMENEKNTNWSEIINYLYSQWQQQKENGELCILLIQQLLEYLLAIDTPPFSPSVIYLHEKERLQTLLNESITYGMEHCITNKYFLWQICYYLVSISTYYFLYDCLVKDDRDRLDLLQKLVNSAQALFPNSLLFFQFHESTNDYNYKWYMKLDNIQKETLLSEVNELCLQNNSKDQDILNYFSSLLKCN